MIASFIETDGVRGAVGVAGRELIVASDGERTVREISERAAQLGGFIFQYPDIPILAYGIKRSDGLSELDVSGAYKDLRKAGKGTVLQEHLVSVGNASATRYGFLTNNSDRSRLKFADIGIRDIELERRDVGDRRTDKRLKPFLAYKKLVTDGEDDRFFTRDRKIAGAGAAIITLGAVTVYVTRHFRHE